MSCQLLNSDKVDKVIPSGVDDDGTNELVGIHSITHPLLDAESAEGLFEAVHILTPAFVTIHSVVGYHAK